MADTNEKTVEESTLSIGRINYANCDPLFHQMESDQPDFVALDYGHPSELNCRFLQGKLDIAPLSSIFHYKYQQGCLVHQWGIACEGAVNSVRLFSKAPFDSLSGSLIRLSAASETSNLLLKLLIREHLGDHVNYHTAKHQLDDHLHSKPSVHEPQALLKIGNSAMHQDPDYPFTTDLGTLWHQSFRLPFVFAIFIKRDKHPLVRESLLNHFFKMLESSLEQADFPSLASYYSTRYKLEYNQLKEYYPLFSYRLGEHHWKGMDTFIGLLRKHNLLDSKIPQEKRCPV